MPETNEFINKLMNKKDDELDNLLSYADGKKSKTGKGSDADTILDELLQKPESATSEKISHDVKIISSVPLSSGITKNYHHVYLIHDTTEYISYGSICDFSEEDTAPVISDEPERDDNSVISDSTEISEAIKHAADISPENNSNTADDLLDDGISGFDRFLSEQENRHPKFYFALGLSIFLVVMLGIISCAYLGLNAMKNFADSYRTGAFIIPFINI